MRFACFVLTLLMAFSVRALEGYGTSVFSSEKGQERFEFTVLGTMQNFAGPGQDLILVEMKGERFEKSGVPAGMSGSPTYVDGKLLGAISYAVGEFSTHAIAGITPIGNMMNISSVTANGTWGNIKPVALPLVSNSLAPSVATNFLPHLQKLGFDVISPGAGRVDSKLKSDKLEAGGPVAVVVIEGDMSLAALGTVTKVEGNEFWAFGHPFQQTGKSDLPVANAEIVTTLFSPLKPQKIGQAGKVIGALTDDRSPGIAGKIGLVPRVTPLSLQVNDQRWHFKIARHISMTPVFASMAIQNSLVSRVGRELGGTYRMQIDALLSTGERVQVERQVSGFQQSLEDAVGAVCLDSLGALLKPDLESAEIDELHVKVVYNNEVKISKLMSADLGARARPGQEIQARVMYKPWQKKSTEKILKVFIPRGLKSGDYNVVVADREHALNLETSSGLYESPQTLSENLKQLTSLPKDTEACIYLYNEQMSTLPASMKELNAGISHVLGSTMLHKAVRLGCVDLQGVVVGIALGSIRIERK